MPGTIKTPKLQVNGTVFKHRSLEKLTPVLAWTGFFHAGRCASRLGFYSEVFEEQMSWRSQARPALLKRAATSPSCWFQWALGVFAIALDHILYQDS